MNTNSYIVVKFHKSHRKIVGYPMSTYLEYRVESGNIIKLGRVEFRVVEMGGTKVKGKK